MPLGTYLYTFGIKVKISDGRREKAGCTVNTMKMI